MIDLTGKRFTRWTVLRYVGPAKGDNHRWECICDCGRGGMVLASNLRSGQSMSCGCLRSERTIETFTQHGDAPTGARRTRIYRIWQSMRRRCLTPSHKNFDRYGGRGITICPEWDDYETFKAWALANGYRDDLTIDRIDNDGNYTPANCRWATRLTQSRNRSTTRNKEA